MSSCLSTVCAFTELQSVSTSDVRYQMHAVKKLFSHSTINRHRRSVKGKCCISPLLYPIPIILTLHRLFSCHLLISPHLSCALCFNAVCLSSHPSDSTQLHYDLLFSLSACEGRQLRDARQNRRHQKPGKCRYAFPNRKYTLQMLEYSRQSCQSVILGAYDSVNAC